MAAQWDLAQWDGGRAGTSQGIAWHRMDLGDASGRIAVVAQATAGEGGIRVARLSACVNIGRVVNRDIALQQIEDLLQRWRAYAGRYAIAFVFMAMVAGATALSAWIMKDVINQIFVERNQSALVWVPLAILAIFVAKGFATYLQEVMLARIGNSIVADTQKRIYAHLLAMHSALMAAGQGRLQITIHDTYRALRKAIRYAHQSIADEYERSTMSSGETLHRWVLLACALAKTDKHGYFTPGDVVMPMSTIMKKDCPTSLFSKHLNGFCEVKHDLVLRRTATADGYKYKFRNAIMQPYVLMKGFEARIIS